MSLPALDAGVDRLSTQAFLPWLDLVYPLPMQALLIPPGSTSRWGGDAPGVDLMASQIDFWFHTTTFVWLVLFLWRHPGWSRVVFWTVSQARTPRGSIHLPYACAHFWVLSWPKLDLVSYKEMNNNQDVPSECQHASIHESKRGGGGSTSEEKVIFVLKLLGPILPVHSHRFHKRNI